MSDKNTGNEISIRRNFSDSEIEAIARYRRIERRWLDGKGDTTDSKVIAAVNTAEEKLNNFFGNEQRNIGI